MEAPKSVEPVKKPEVIPPQKRVEPRSSVDKPKIEKPEVPKPSPEKKPSTSAQPTRAAAF